jgi:hypothetical protein
MRIFLSISFYYPPIFIYRTIIFAVVSMLNLYHRGNRLSIPSLLLSSIFAPLPPGPGDSPT